MQFTNTELILIVILGTGVFLLAPLFLLINFKEYNRRKQEAIEERKDLEIRFEAELLRTHLEVQEQTMQTIATDLHDNIGQLLSLTTLTLNSINLTNMRKSEEKIAASLGLINSSIKELRDLAKLLQGEKILEAGLGHTLQQELERLERIGGYDLKIDNQLSETFLSSPKKDLIILRLLQEIINNIIKHAQATDIKFGISLKGELLSIMVTENGIGFDYDEIKQQNKGIGLYSIHKRIEMIGGSIKIDSIRSYGTVINIQIPYP